MKKEEIIEKLKQIHGVEDIKDEDLMKWLNGIGIIELTEDPEKDQFIKDTENAYLLSCQRNKTSKYDQEYFRRYCWLLFYRVIERIKDLESVVYNQAQAQGGNKA